ncbi:MAG: hypothetical protein FWH34_06285, partial [Desulfovibrionaceae bacterium]|nr:hypothetical protein [Desulfovibrionaceae bacterium]
MNKTITLLIIGVIFLALLLMMLNSFKMEERHGLPASVTEKVRPQEKPSPARVPEEHSASAPEAQSSAALAPPAAQSLPQSAKSDAAEQTPSAAGVAVKTVPAQIDAGHATPAPPPSPSAPARLAPPQVPAAPEPS